MILPGADGQPFNYSVPAGSDRVVRVIFGRGCLEEAPAEARLLGQRVLLIAGRHQMSAADAVSAQLGRNLVHRIREVTPHVPVRVAARAVAAAKKVDAQVVVAIGGGSATGLAKAIARDSGLPIVAVPTTYAGSELTPIWGESDAGGKRTGRDWRVLPHTVLYDPALTVSMPAPLTAASGMNALAHAVEALYAPDRTGVSSTVALEAFRDLVHGLPVAVDEPGDPHARAQALRGAWLAGWALGSTTMGLHHKAAHVLGGRYELWHAGLHSALLPQVAAFNATSARDLLTPAVEILGGTGGEDVGPALFDLASSLGAPTALQSPRLPQQDLADIARIVAVSGVPNPRPFSVDEVHHLLQFAYAGQRPATASSHRLSTPHSSSDRSSAI